MPWFCSFPPASPCRRGPKRGTGGDLAALCAPRRQARGTSVLRRGPARGAGSQAAVSAVFDACWSVLLIDTSRAVAGRVLAVPVRLRTALISGMLGVAAGFGTQAAVAGHLAGASPISCLGACRRSRGVAAEPVWGAFERGPRRHASRSGGAAGPAPCGG
jgi:hypothetical protein